MNYIDKIYTIKTSIILFFLGISVFIFETVPQQFDPTFSTNNVGYITFFSASLLFILTLLYNSLKKEKQGGTPMETQTNYKAVENNDLTELATTFKETGDEVEYLYRLIQNSFNEDIFGYVTLLLQNSKDSLATQYEKVKNSLEDNVESQLFKRFMDAYISGINSVLNQTVITQENIVNKMNPLKESYKNNVFERLRPKLTTTDKSILNIKLEH
jgi:hypothetical protein